MPIWYDENQRVHLTSFKSWGDVVNWALPLYKFDTQKVKKISNKFIHYSNEKEKIIDIIRYVQDDIRYLGFEYGVGAYKPNSPYLVNKNKYGDCKDKSLLLVALLRREGLTAYPMLVNTSLKHKTVNQIPSNQAFNHCVVNLKYKSKNYFIDPTISNQGGNLSNLFFPDYKYGLILNKGQKKLIKIPSKNKSVINVNEMITIHTDDNDADLTVRTEYYGDGSDNIRYYFNSTKKEAIERNYLNHYSYSYPKIKLIKDIKFLDYSRNRSNKIIVEEYYLIRDFWKKDSENSDNLYSEIYPIQLNVDTDYPNTSNRTMPYSLGDRYTYKHYTQIVTPEDWKVKPFQNSINHEAFSFSNSISQFGPRNITYETRYKRKKTYVDAESTAEFLEKNGELRKNMSFMLTYNKKLSGYKFSWLTVSIILISFILSCIFAYKIYYEYNPEPWKYAENFPIGGWLILPAIGILISPFILVFNIISLEHFNANVWSSIWDYPFFKAASLTLLILLETVYSISLFVFYILIIILFFRRRTSLPKLIIILYLSSLVIPILEHLAVDWIDGNILTSQDMDEIIRSSIIRGIFAAVLVPVFYYSERVKSTFCKQLR